MSNCFFKLPYKQYFNIVQNNLFLKTIEIKKFFIHLRKVQNFRIKQKKKELA